MHGDQNWTLYNPDFNAWRERALSFRAPFRKPRRDR